MSQCALIRPWRCRASALGALARYNRPHDGSPGHAHHVAEHLGKLQVHLNQRFLHALYPVGLFGHQDFALTYHCAHYADLIAGTPGCPEQP
jgi:hypothetical protein